MSGSGDGGQAIVTAALDWILARFPPPELIKIDIEDMGYGVLQGANRTLKLKPTVLCEVTQDHENIGSLLTFCGIHHDACDQETGPSSAATAFR
jgi:hypothetical protein